jgi:hypothetical protein
VVLIGSYGRDISSIQDDGTTLRGRLGRSVPELQRPARGRFDRVMANDRLRAAMQAAHLDIEDVARAVEVDPKTVQRWLAGRIPRPRHRWALVDLLGEQEELLWLRDGRSAVAASQTAEIVAAYAHRVDAPLTLWFRLLFRSRQQIDLLGYAMLFFPEQHPHFAGAHRGAVRDRRAQGPHRVDGPRLRGDPPAR